MVSNILALVGFLSGLFGINGYLPSVDEVRSPAIAYAQDSMSIRRVMSLPKADVRLVTIPSKKVGAIQPPSFTAQSVLVVDDESGTSLFEQNADKKVPLASITKLAAALTFVELDLPLSRTIVIEESDIIEERSALSVGDSVSYEDLLSLSLVGSSNTAASTLIRASGLSEEYFVGRMNASAKSLGLTSSQFVEPTGLDSENIGTARDAYRLLIHAMEHETLGPMMSLSEYSFSNGRSVKRVFSTNVFMIGILKFNSKKILGAKTGHIPEAGFHFAMSAIDKTNKLRHVIVLGATDHFARFTEADALLSWASDNFE